MPDRDFDAMPLAPFLRIIPLLFFRKGNVGRLIQREDSIAIAMLVIFINVIASGYVTTEPSQVFLPRGITALFAQLFLITSFCYLYSKFEWKLIPATLLLSLILEVWACIGSIQTVVESIAYTAQFPLEFTKKLAILFQVWGILAVSNVLLMSLSHVSIAKLFVVTYVAVTVVPVWFFDFMKSEFWYQAYIEGEQPVYVSYDYEKIFYGQDELIAKALAGVEVGNPKKIDLFYLGFAGYSDQDVFKKEVRYIDTTLNEKLSLEGRGILLINHAETIDTVPLAINRNIDLALGGIKARMDEEDILLFYLTSHGSMQHVLSVEFYPFQFIGVSTQSLLESIDKSGIKWIMIVISACYSGGFIEPLKDDYTIVATASDAENTSLGCGKDRELTYYAEAVFKDQVAKGIPLLSALKNANELITDRETKENESHSNPQLWIGDRIREHIIREQVKFLSD